MTEKHGGATRLQLSDEEFSSSDRRTKCIIVTKNSSRGIASIMQGSMYVASYYSGSIVRVDSINTDTMYERN